VALCVPLATGLQAAVPEGRQVFNALGPNSTDTGNIQTATTFTLGGFRSNPTNHTGIFAGLPSVMFGSVTFSKSGLVLTDNGVDGLFGTFASTSITESIPGPGLVQFDVLGHWTPGTFNGFSRLPRSPFLSVVDIRLSQSAPNATVTLPGFTLFTPAPTNGVPEPSSLGLLVAGLVGVMGLRKKRRFQS